MLFINTTLSMEIKSELKYYLYKRQKNEANCPPKNPDSEVDITFSDVLHY